MAKITGYTVRVLEYTNKLMRSLLTTLRLALGIQSGTWLPFLCKPYLHVLVLAKLHPTQAAP